MTELPTSDGWPSPAVAPAGPPIGILAGIGSLPVEIAQSLTAAGARVQVVAIGDGTDERLEGYPVVHAAISEIGKILSAFKSAGCRQIVIVGGVARPDLTRLRVDWGLLLNLHHALRLVFSGGDDGVLRRVVRFFELKGFEVLSPAEIAPSVVVGAGTLGLRATTPDEAADILLGSSVVKALGRFDIGQAVVVASGRVLAIEAAEGTDRMLERVARTRAAGQNDEAAAGGVLVKRPKPGQELRVDLPAIGPATIERAKAAGLAGIAVLAGQTLIASRLETLRAARAAGLFVYGFTEGDGEPTRRRTRRARILADLEPVAGGQPAEPVARDLRLAAAVLSMLAALRRDGACVVARGHILGLEPHGGAAALLDRTGRLHQWGLRRVSRRMGVAVLGEANTVTAPLIEAAAKARLLAIGVLGEAVVAAHVIEAARAAGIALVRIGQVQSEDNA